MCGVETRNTCTAGYKANFQDGAYPTRDYLGALNPGFADLVASKLSTTLSPLGGRAGDLTAEAAGWMGLPAGIAVAVANVDAHVTVPAAGVVEPGRLVAIMGTSTCHMLLGDRLTEVPGMCGVVDGGIIPGLYGYEAGQSGVGDIFAWFVKHAVPAAYASDGGGGAGIGAAHEALEREAAAQKPGEHGLLALDWWNGNRSVLVDANLSGLLVGMTLATRAPDIYRALIESTAYGTRLIIENFERCGVPVRELVIAGGLQKNQLLMQIYADVTGRPLSLVDSEQGPALGSAMHAAVAAGLYPTIADAAARMGRIRRNVYTPNPAAARAYDRLYADYVVLHDYFGRGANDVMKRLKGAGAPHEPRCPAPRSREPAPRAAPQRPRHLDQRQHQRPRLLVGHDADQAERRHLRGADARTAWCSATTTGGCWQGASSRRPTRRRTATSTATCRASAASCTRTARMPRRGRPTPARSRAS